MTKTTVLSLIFLCYVTGLLFGWAAILGNPTPEGAYVLAYCAITSFGTATLMLALFILEIATLRLIEAGRIILKAWGSQLHAKRVAKARNATAKAGYVYREISHRTPPNVWVPEGSTAWQQQQARLAAWSRLERAKARLKALTT